MRRCFAVFIFALALAGCASITDPTKDWPVEKFYQAAKENLDAGNYEEAIKLYEQLQGRYPYGRYAEQAQLETAYAYYKYDEPALAVAACDRFIRQFPTHAHVDYAYYLKGLVNFRDKRSFGTWLFGSGDDLHDRDPRATRESFEAFKELVERFPASRYAEDARLRMTYLFEAQARYEVSVAEYYYKRRAYVAAVNRTRYALENYPRTPATENALGIQALAYKRMGLQQLHEDTLKILTRNFPNSRYLKEIAAAAPG
jgi:outer membrane protein assembly factor BamD